MLGSGAGNESKGKRPDVDELTTLAVVPGDQVEPDQAAPLPGRRRIAVIGAGLSGLACARTLSDLGFTVDVFDKARGVGGRTATRRQDDLTFDHGAAFFTVRDPAFRQWCNLWQAEGLVAPWHGRFHHGYRADDRPAQPPVERYVGVPGMNALARRLAADLTVHLNCTITAAAVQDGHWTLTDAQGQPLGPFDAVVVSTPSPQAVPLLAAAPDLAAQAAGATMRPCWAGLWVGAITDAWDAWAPGDSVLAWMARETSRPGRSGPDRWVLHADHAWSQTHLEDSPDAVAAAMQAAVARLTGQTAAPDQLTVHRWRYALPQPALRVDCLFDPALAIGACGDWCRGARIEDAFLSGAAMAERLVDWATASARSMAL
jgi:renalase